MLVLLPIVPVVLLGESWASGFWEWAQGDAAPFWLALAAMALLAADIFLPVPSGPLLVFTAAQLGAAWAVGIGAVGLTLGAWLGYWAARLGGRRVALRWASQQELDRWESVFQNEGTWLLFLTRPLPIVAEAVVLAAGLGRMPATRFLIVVAIANTLIAVVYAVLGQYAAENDIVLIVVVVVAAAPLVVMRLVRRRRTRS